MTTLRLQPASQPASPKCHALFIRQHRDRVMVFMTNGAHAMPARAGRNRLISVSGEPAPVRAQCGDRRLECLAGRLSQNVAETCGAMRFSILHKNPVQLI